MSKPTPRNPKAAISSAELDDLIVKAATPSALAATPLRRALPSSYRPLEKQWPKVLARLVSEGRLHRWPVGRGGRYAIVPYDEFARERVRAALANGPRTKAELEKSSGVMPSALGPLLAKMKAAGELYAHPQRRYGSRPAEDLEYVLLADIEKLIRSHVRRGVAAEVVRAAIARWAGSGAVAAPSDSAILDAMQELNPQVAQGDSVYLPHLRVALKDRFPDKLSFDRAVLALAEQRRVQLQSHPVPSQLKPAERESMIDNGSGSFYMVIGLRR
jgi:hypothetical protein